METKEIKLTDRLENVISECIKNVMNSSKFYFGITDDSSRENIIRRAIEGNEDLLMYKAELSYVIEKFCIKLNRTCARQRKTRNDWM